MKILVRKVKGDTLQMNLSKKKVIIGISLIVISLIIINIIVQKYREADKVMNNVIASSNKQKEDVIEKTIDAGDFRVYRSSEETRWIFYDNAMFEDNFDGFKFKINPIALSNKSELYQNKYIGAVGSSFTISNESSSTFTFNTTKLEVTTNKNHPLNQNNNTNKIKNTTFRPGDKINDPIQGMITFISDNTDLESVDWVNFKFEINKLNEDGDIVKSKRYNLKFNISKHFTDNIPQDAKTFIDRYQKFTEVNKDLGLLPLTTNDINIRTFDTDGTQSHAIDLFKSDYSNNYSSFSLILSEDKQKTNTILFTGDVKNGSRALLGTAGALGIQDNTELQNFLTEELVSVVNSNQNDYSKTFKIKNHSIRISYDQSMGLTFFVSF